MNEVKRCWRWFISSACVVATLSCAWRYRKARLVWLRLVFWFVCCRSSLIKRADTSWNVRVGRGGRQRPRRRRRKEGSALLGVWARERACQHGPAVLLEVEQSSGQPNRRAELAAGARGPLRCHPGVHRRDLQGPPDNFVRLQSLFWEHLPAEQTPPSDHLPQGRARHGDEVAAEFYVQGRGERQSPYVTDVP